MVKRIEHFDMLRGLSILAVVAIHCSGAGLRFDENSMNFNVTVFWRNILNFSVPMFLAISGYFLAKKEIESRRHYISFIKKQLPRVYFPLVIWSFVWFASSVFIKKEAWIDEFVKILTFQSSAPYYFVALIVQYYFLIPLFKILANKKGLFLSMVISMVMVVVIFYLRYMADVQLPLVVYAGNFATWQMFFVLGLYLGKFEEINISNKFLIFLVLIFYFLSCLESYILIGFFHQPAHAVTAVKISSFIYSYFLIIFLFKNHGLIKSKVLYKIGVNSFSIYLVHMFFIWILSRGALYFVPLLIEFTYVYQLALTAAVIISCAVLSSICNASLPERLSKMLGFRTT